MRNKIAVISRNEDFLEFFRIEAEIQDIFVFALKEWEEFFSLDEKVALLIVDTDTVGNTEKKISCASVGFTSVGNLYGVKNSLKHWPTSIDTVKSIFASIKNTGKKEKNNTDTFREIAVDKISGRAIYGGVPFKLSGHEIIVLETLCAARGAFVSREELNSRLGAERGNISDVYFCKLRKKLEAGSDTRLIFTERGKGYRTDLVLTIKIE